MSFFATTKIASRYLRGGSRRRILSLSSLMSVIGMTLGVAAVCIVTGVFNGFIDILSRSVVDKMGHFIIYNRQDWSTRKDFIDGPMKLLPADLHWEPFGWIDGAMGAGGRGGKSIAIEGVAPEGWSSLKKFAIESDGTPPTGHDVWVGESLAQDLGVKVGDVFQVIVPSSASGKRLMHRTRSVRVAALMAVGMQDYDGKMVLMPLAELATWLDWPAEATGFRVRVSEEDYEATERSLTEQLDTPWTFRSWKQLHRNFFQSIVIEKYTLTLVVGMIIILGLFNVVSTLYLQSSEKIHDLAMLAAMGARKTFIGRVFFWNGALFGGLGASLGIGLALIVTCLLKQFPIIQLPRDVYNLSRLPIVIHPLEWISVWCLTILAAMLASLIPAWRSQRMNPVDGLRYE